MGMQWGEPMSMAGYRTPQLLGGDKWLVLVTLFACLGFGVLSFLTMAKWTLVLPLVVWFLLLRVYQRMAKVDPLLRQVAYRHIWMRRYYPARSGIGAGPVSFP